MKNIFSLVVCLLAGSLNSQTYSYLDINQVKAKINSGGNLHNYTSIGDLGYECPKGSGKQWSSVASLWIGGYDINNQLHLSAQTYNQFNTDYWAGPLSTNAAATNSTISNQYNRVWKLNKTDVDDFISNFANGNVQN